MGRSEGKRRLRGERGTVTVSSPHSTTQVLDDERLTEGRARIAREALLLFLRHGYHGTPVRVIATACGISVGSIFNYFTGKEEILQYVLEENHNRIETALQAAQRDLESRQRRSDPVALFLSICRRYLELIDEVRKYTLLAYQETKSIAPGQRKPLFDRDRRIAALLRQAARPAIESGAFPEKSLELKITSIMHLGQAWAVRRWMLNQYSNVEEYWEELSPLVLAIMQATR